MRGLRALALSLVQAVVAATSLSAQEEEVEIRVQQAAPGVFMLVGQGGNIGVSVGSDGLFLIDDQYAPLGPKIRQALATLSDQPVRFLLNTHWHADHTGGNAGFAKTGAVIFSHRNARIRLAKGQRIEALARDVAPAPAEALPVVTFSTDLRFHWNGDEIHAIHVQRAHTDGDAIVHFERADVIHAGDTYFGGRYPFIDLSSGGSVTGLIAAVDKMLALATSETVVIPGHGAISTRADLSAYRSMLWNARQRVREAIAAGTSAERHVAEKPLADFDASWDGGFVSSDAFVRTLHQDLRGE